MADPYEARLMDTPIDTWANTILWKLAVVTGYAIRGRGYVDVDVDDVLDEALRLITKGREAERTTDG